MKNVAVLGSTGSIGENTLDVISRFPERFRVLSLAAGSNRLERLAAQLEATGARTVSVPGPGDADRLRSMTGPGVEIGWGTEGLIRAATAEGVDLVVSAVVGAAGLVPTYAAVLGGKDVALANKESLVVAGELVMAAARKTGAQLLPVDSEHSALFQSLEGHRAEDVRRLVLTASGGPFRGRTRASLQGVTVSEALAHPNWSMGRKITIDSATLMNKGLEVIEARWLFDVEPERVEVTLHPQSVIHSLVEFVDGSMIGQLGMPDMRGPISYALAYPERLPMEGLNLDLWSLSELTFEAPDLDTFPCLSLAYHALEQGGSAPAVLSGANEIAVDAFLSERIGFLEIPQLVADALDAHSVVALDSVHTALDADRWARQYAREWVKKSGGG